MSTLELGSLQGELGAINVDLGGFTPVTVTGSYSLQGDPAAGTVTFTLTQPLANSGVIVPCSPLIVEVDAGGNLTAVLVATDDVDTAPQGVVYGVTEQITGAQPRDYFISVPNAVTPADLSTLMPTDTGWL